MTGNRVRSLVICMILVALATVAWAGPKAEEPTGGSTEATAVSSGPGYWELLGKVQDTSDLPTWTGKQLKIIQWYAHGTGMAEHLTAENDVVLPEVKRVTGVELDKQNSFDNDMGTLDLKMSLLAASGDWPDIISATEPREIRDLVKAGKLYDLTDLLPKYAPDLMKIYDPVKFPETMKKITAEVTKDRIFFVPIGAPRELTYAIVKNMSGFSQDRYARIMPPSPMSDWTKIWVRDDILKKMYPNALTQDEIEAIYAKNGTFTKEQIFDVPIRSTADFLKFMRDMKALIAKEGIMENGRPVEVTFAANDADNWPVMTCFLPQIYGVPTVDYFQYFDKKLGKIVYTFQQPWFKSMIQDYQKLVLEGVVSRESLIDNAAIFTEKLNSGQYAMSFAWLKPDEANLKELGRTYRYRHLWPDVSYNYTQFAELQGPLSSSHSIGIFKDSVAEEDLPQILRYLNYMASDIGAKLTYWGPRTAGLFKEVNGVRAYTDKALEQNMLYDEDNKANIKYNLYSYNMSAESYRYASPPYPIGYYAGLQHPRYVYPELQRKGSSADTYFQPGMLPGYAREDRFVFVTQSDFLPQYVDQWSVVIKGRTVFEDALTATLAAKDNAQFEKLWATMLETADQIGLNAAALAEVNRIFTRDSPNAIADSAKINK